MLESLLLYDPKYKNKIISNYLRLDDLNFLHVSLAFVVFFDEEKFLCIKGKKTILKVFDILES